MKPGRELDLLVAEKVMGYQLFDSELANEGLSNSLHVADIPKYSTDIAAALGVVEKMKDAGFSCGVFREKWVCLIGNVSGPDCNTAPHAICLAALKAVGVEA